MQLYVPSLLIPLYFVKSFMFPIRYKIYFAINEANHSDTQIIKEK